MARAFWIVAALSLCGVVSAQITRETPTEIAEPASSFWWADYDGDALPDAFVVTPEGKALLLQNRGDGTLTDVTQQAGLDGIRLPRFATWEDFDGDGTPDLFVGTLVGPSLLFENQGGTFVEVGASAGLTHAGEDLHASWLDYDANGLPDLHVRTAEESLLYRNLGEGAFEPVDLGLSAAAPAPLAGPTTTSPEVSQASSKSAPSGAGPGSLPEETPGSNGTRKLAAVPDQTAVGVGEEGGVIASSPTVSEAVAFPTCARTIRDQATGNCIAASSVPVLGQLCPVSANLYQDPVSGFIGMGTITPTVRLDVIGQQLSRGGFLGPMIKADSQFTGPTRGYLGIQGSANFDGIPTASWLGYEIGAAGISTDGSSGDNFGVMGHSNGVAVRGEFASGPTTAFGELGAFPGVGVRGSGPTAAGEFLGNVEVEEGDVVLINSTPRATLWLNESDSGGSSISAYDEDGTRTFYLDSDWASSQSPRMQMRNGADNRIGFEVDVGFADEGGTLRVYNDASIQTIALDGDGGSGGHLEMFADDGTQTVVIDSENIGGALLALKNDTGGTRVLIDGDNVDGGSLVTYAADGSTAVFVDGEGLNSGGEISVYNDLNQQTIELIGDYANNEGAITLWDRQAAPDIEGLRIRARDGGGTGAEILMRNQSGNIGIDFDAGGTVAAIMYLRETDGSSAMDFVNNRLTLRNAAGVATITFDRSTGAKSAVVDTPHHGLRKFYAMEAPGVWFEDFGVGQLTEGEAKIQLDPIFLDSVTISDQHPMEVFVTLTGECNGVYVTKGRGHFVVHELNGGTSDATFDWRVVAKRRGLENLRLEPLEEEALAADLDVPQRAPRRPPEVAQDAPLEIEVAPAPVLHQEGSTSPATAPVLPEPSELPTVEEPIADRE